MTATPTSPGVPTTISNLPAAGAITGSEYVPIVQNGVTSRATVNVLSGSVISITAGTSMTVSPSSGQGVVTVGVAAGGITATQIASGTITGTQIASGTITGTQIASGTITGTQIASSIALAGSPTTTTQSSSDSSTKIATTAMVQSVATGLITYNAIAGCLITSLAGTHTTASATITSGQAADSTNAAYITSVGYSWAASNGNAINGTDAASSTLANSTTYHMFLCSGGSGTGTFCSASLTPTFPTGYTTYSRRIGSFNTDGSGNPLPYISVEIGGGSTINWLNTQVQDVNVSDLSTSRVNYTLSVPTGIKVQPIIRAATQTGNEVILLSADENDVAPHTVGAAPGYDTFYGGSLGTWATPFLTTNTSGQISARASGSSTTFYVNTRGWLDFRRS